VFFNIRREKGGAYNKKCLSPWRKATEIIHLKIRPLARTDFRLARVDRKDAIMF
jgi:hypothetical protein